MTVEESNRRMEICRKCPLYKETYLGEYCNNNKYISPDGTKASYIMVPGYIKGCGCNLAYKTKEEHFHCVAKKW